MGLRREPRVRREPARRARTRMAARGPSQHRQGRGWRPECTCNRASDSRSPRESHIPPATRTMRRYRRRNTLDKLSLHRNRHPLPTARREPGLRTFAWRRKRRSHSQDWLPQSRCTRFRQTRMRCLPSQRIRPNPLPAGSKRLRRRRHSRKVLAPTYQELMLAGACFPAGRSLSCLRRNDRITTARVNVSRSRQRLVREVIGLLNQMESLEGRRTAGSGRRSPACS